MNDGQKKILPELFPDGKLKLWAFSDRYKKSWSKIKPGDIIFLKENGSSFFDFTGEIVATFEGDPRIGQTIWNDGKWTGLLFINNLEYKAKIPLNKVSELLCPTPNSIFQCPSVREVNEEELLLLKNNRVHNNS